MIKLDCAICGKNQKLKLLYPQNFDLTDLTSKKFSARRTPDGKHFQFMECQKCGLIFSSPVPKTSEINKLYFGSEFIYNEESKYLKQTYGKILTGFVPELNKKLRLLEIGCGNGFFLEEAKRLGINAVYGIEPSLPAVIKSASWLKKRIKVDVLKVGVYKAKSFDIICCFHTLDHIPDPSKFLKIALSYLKKDGRAIFVVHDTAGLSVKIFGEKSAIFDIEHMYLFNKSNLEEIFLKNGFAVSKVSDVRNTYPLSYWFRMIPMPPFLKKILSFILTKTFLDKIPVTIKPGNIAILAFKP